MKGAREPDATYRLTSLRLALSIEVELLRHNQYFEVEREEMAIVLTVVEVEVLHVYSEYAKEVVERMMQEQEKW